MSIKCVLDIHAVNVCYSATRTSAKYFLNKNHQILMAISFVLLLLLSACGGGGGSSGTNSPPDPVSPGLSNDPILFVNPGPDGDAVSINGNLATSAEHNSPVVKFNNSGVGFSVWQVETGTGVKVLYTLYDPVSMSWSEEEVLYSGSFFDKSRNISLILNYIQVASNGTGFAVTWTDSKDVFAKIYNPESVSKWSDLRKLNDINIQPLTQPKISSNGTEYVVTWAKERKIVASMSSGMEWSATPTFIGNMVPTGIRVGFSSNDLGITSNGQGFLISWMAHESKADQTVISSVYASVYTQFNGWEVVNQINESDLDLKVSKLKLAANSNGYIVSWWTSLGSQQPFIGKANVYHSGAGVGRSWLGENIITDQVGSVFHDSLIASNNGFAFAWINNVPQRSNARSIGANTFKFDNTPGWQGVSELSPAATGYPPSFIDLASNGENYMIVWRDKLSTIYSKSQNGMLCDVDATELAANENAIFSVPFVHSNGSDYIAVWHQADASNTPSYSSSSSDLYASHYVPAMGWTRGDLVQEKTSHRRSSVFKSDGNISVSHFDNQYFVYWISDSESDFVENVDPKVKKFDLNWSESQKLTKKTHYGSSDLPGIFSNENDQLLSIWLQSVRSYTRVFASVRSDNKWSQPIHVDHDENIVLNRTGWRPGSEPRFYSASGNGSTFVVVWEYRNNVYSKLFDGQGWSAEPLLVSDEGTGGPEINTTPLGDGYISVWSKKDIANQKINIYSSIYNNGTWTQQVVAEMDNANGFSIDPGSNPKVVSNRDGDYAIVWRRGKPGGYNEVHARININGQWINQQTIVQDTQSIYSGYLQVAANNSGKFVVAWYQPGNFTLPGIYTSVFDPVVSTWSQAELFPQSNIGQSPELTSNGNNFAIVWK